ncbi:hypothetical protein CI109_101384 [Kwoniella shandongensis]|uniref:Uncharacterized protein n=1 Tax=Kwoniella shandongensis TaxID=1734106 RepID=A0A5M6BZW0_9TREE|nr:uncharacterized protein CI109_005081 [Kwoniella shandongensis]KAA5526509.1 hypothetical protein CI109_005081 [Kwoniella shandongensis]
MTTTAQPPSTTPSSSSRPSPSLLYHSSEPTLYPTNDPCTSLLVVRFNVPVRIESLRITPEGIESFSGPGVTYPPSFRAQLLLNVSPSNPVNALASSEIVVEESKHPLDYHIGMPVGVTTRMMMLRSPVQRLTISVYGFTPTDDTNGMTTGASAVISHTTLVVSREKEDWSWLWTWAGKDYNALLHLLNSHTPTHISHRAMSSLDLLLDTGYETSPLYSALLAHPTALPFLLSLPAQPAQPILTKLFDEPEYALSPRLRENIPLDHRFRPLVQANSSARHAAAWKHLQLGRAALVILKEEGCDEVELLRTERGEEKSNLVRLLEMGVKFAGSEDEESVRCLGMALDLLNSPPTDPLALDYLARRLPRLVAVNNIRGDPRQLSLPGSHARQVVTSLISVSTETIDGESMLAAATLLAQPYIQHLGENDPLRLIFASDAKSTAIKQISFSDTADGRRLSRLHRALDPAFNLQSSFQHVVTPAELLSLLAPHLVKSLSTASIPPFGITPSMSYASPTESQGVSASAYAGKVYSSHEFRTRDHGATSSGTGGSSVGLGIAGLSGGGVGGGVAGMVAGVGGVGGVGGSRPASRHVDDYRRGV